MADVSFPAAFGAGLLSFVSPCVLPLVPSYISYITGLSIEQLTDSTVRSKFKKAIVVNALLFIGGFSAVFVAFGATASYRDRLVAQAAVTLRETTDQAPNRIMARLVNRRHFPDLREGRHDSPLVSELVRQKTRDVTMSTIWTGDASLSLPASSVHELGDLSPVRVGPGYRYTMAMTIDDLAVLGSAVPPIR